MQRVHSQRNQALNLELLHSRDEHEEHKVTSCPDCGNRLFFLEAAFLCPICGYSMETVYS